MKVIFTNSVDPCDDEVPEGEELIAGGLTQPQAEVMAAWLDEDRKLPCLSSSHTPLTR
jgi:hypothetical protein